MSPSWVDHGAAAQAKWHYPLSCQILPRVETLHMLARHPRRWGDLTQSLNACHFFPEPDTSHLYNNWLLAALPCALFLQPCFVCSKCLGSLWHLWWFWEMQEKKSQEHWTVAVATLSSSDHDFQYFKNFSDTLRASGKQGKEEKKYFKVSMLPKGITISHRALSYQKDDDVDVLS